jgi:hypothetical protein
MLKHSDGNATGAHDSSGKAINNDVTYTGRTDYFGDRPASSHGDQTMTVGTTQGVPQGSSSTQEVQGHQDITLAPRMSTTIPGASALEKLGLRVRGDYQGMQALDSLSDRIGSRHRMDSQFNTKNWDKHKAKGDYQDHHKELSEKAAGLAIMSKTVTVKPKGSAMAAIGCGCPPDKTPTAKEQQAEGELDQQAIANQKGEPVRDMPKTAQLVNGFPLVAGFFSYCKTAGYNGIQMIDLLQFSMKDADEEFQKQAAGFLKEALPSPRLDALGDQGISFSNKPIIPGHMTDTSRTVSGPAVSASPQPDALPRYPSSAQGYENFPSMFAKQTGTTPAEAKAWLGKQDTRSFLDKKWQGFGEHTGEGSGRSQAELLDALARGAGREYKTQAQGRIAQQAQQNAGWTGKTLDYLDHLITGRGAPRRGEVSRGTQWVGKNPTITDPNTGEQVVNPDAFKKGPQTPWDSAKRLGSQLNIFGDESNLGEALTGFFTAAPAAIAEGTGALDAPTGTFGRDSLSSGAMRSTISPLTKILGITNPELAADAGGLSESEAADYIKAKYQLGDYSAASDTRSDAVGGMHDARERYFADAKRMAEDPRTPQWKRTALNTLMNTARMQQTGTEMVAMSKGLGNIPGGKTLQNRLMVPALLSGGATYGTQLASDVAADQGLIDKSTADSIRPYTSGVLKGMPAFVPSGHLPKMLTGMAGFNAAAPAAIDTTKSLIPTGTGNEQTFQKLMKLYDGTQNPTFLQEAYKVAPSEAQQSALGQMYNSALQSGAQGNREAATAAMIEAGLIEPPAAPIAGAKTGPEPAMDTVEEEPTQESKRNDLMNWLGALGIGGATAGGVAALANRDRSRSRDDEEEEKSAMEKLGIGPSTSLGMPQVPSALNSILGKKPQTLATPTAAPTPAAPTPAAPSMSRQPKKLDPTQYGGVTPEQGNAVQQQQLADMGITQETTQPPTLADGPSQQRRQQQPVPQPEAGAQPLADFGVPPGPGQQAEQQPASQPAAPTKPPTQPPAAPQPSQADSAGGTSQPEQPQVDPKVQAAETHATTTKVINDPNATPQQKQDAAKNSVQQAAQGKDPKELEGQYQRVQEGKLNEQDVQAGVDTMADAADPTGEKRQQEPGFMEGMVNSFMDMDPGMQMALMVGVPLAIGGGLAGIFGEGNTSTLGIIGRLLGIGGVLAGTGMLGEGAQDMVGGMGGSLAEMTGFEGMGDTLMKNPSLLYAAGPMISDQQIDKMYPGAREQLNKALEFRKGQNTPREEVPSFSDAYREGGISGVLGAGGQHIGNYANRTVIDPLKRNYGENQIRSAFEEKGMTPEEGETLLKWYADREGKKYFPKKALALLGVHT